MIRNLCIALIVAWLASPAWGQGEPKAGESGRTQNAPEKKAEKKVEKKAETNGDTNTQAKTLDSKVEDLEKNVARIKELLDLDRPPSARLTGTLQNIETNMSHILLLMFFIVLAVSVVTVGFVFAIPKLTLLANRLAEVANNLNGAALPVTALTNALTGPAALQMTALTNALTGVTGQLTNGVQHLNTAAVNLGTLDTRLEPISNRLGDMATRLDTLPDRVNTLGGRLETLWQHIDQAGDKLRVLGETVTRPDTVTPRLETITTLLAGVTNKLDDVVKAIGRRPDQPTA